MGEKGGKNKDAKRKAKEEGRKKKEQKVEKKTERSQEAEQSRSKSIGSNLHQENRRAVNQEGNPCSKIRELSTTLLN